MTSLKLNQSQFVAFGDIKSYKQLFTQINNKYKATTNSLIISEIENATNFFSIQIRTKYYDFDSNLVILSTSNEIQLDECEDLEGVFILLNSNDDIFYLQNNSVKKVLNENETCYKVVLLNQIESDDEVKKLIEIESYDDLIQIKFKSNSDLDEDEDEFDALDEFVNSLFVHSWSNLKMKTEANKSEEKDIKTLNNQENDLDDENDEDDENFNFEHLISNLAEMRAKASEMNFEERKLYAEDVVKKFWRSIGGNEEEINDLNS